MADIQNQNYRLDQHNNNNSFVFFSLKVVNLRVNKYVSLVKLFSYRYFTSTNFLKACWCNPFVFQEALVNKKNIKDLSTTSVRSVRFG